MNPLFTVIALLSSTVVVFAQVPVPPMKPEALPAQVLEAPAEPSAEPAVKLISKEDSIKNRTPMPLDGYMAITLGWGSALGDLGSAPVRGVQDMQRFPGYASDVVDFGLQAGGYFTPHLGIGVRLNYSTLLGAQGSLSDAFKTVGIGGVGPSGFNYTASTFMAGPRLKYDYRNTEYFCMPLVGFGSIRVNNLSSNIGSNLWYRGNVGWGLTTGFRTKGRVGMLVEVNYTDLGQREGVFNSVANNKMVPDAVAGANDFKQHVAWFSMNVGLCFRIRNLRYNSSSPKTPRPKTKQVLKAKPSVPVMP